MLSGIGRPPSSRQLRLGAVAASPGVWHVSRITR